MGTTNDDARTPGPRPADSGAQDTTGGDSAPSVGDGTGQVRVELPTRRQLRLQQPAGRAAVAPTTGPSREPLPGGRRDRRRQQTTQIAAVGAAQQSEASGASGASGASAASAASGASVGARPADGMGIEEALAARKAQDAGEHAVGTPAAGPGLPVDPDVLARQKILTERAAVLGARARLTHELSEQSRQHSPAPNDPTAPDNLSIVAPPEFVQVPGRPQSVLRAPSTSHVPIVLQRPQQVPEAAHEGIDGRDPDTTPSSGSTVTQPPLGARDAFGLDPLDAMTAGLGRLRRLRTIQYSLLGVGATALVTGIIMTVSSLNG